MVIKYKRKYFNIKLKKRQKYSKTSKILFLLKKRIKKLGRIS